MFDARMLTVLGCLYPQILCHLTCSFSLKMENEENVLAHLSENVIKNEPTPKQKGNKAKTGIWSNKEMDSLINPLE